MFFNSFQFIIFFPIVLIVYYLLPTGSRLRKVWLLVCSYFFYMCWNAAYVVLILISTMVTYVCARLIRQPAVEIGAETHSSSDDATIRRRNRIIVAASLIINLGILGYFKYFNFFTSGINTLMGVFRLNAQIPGFDILLPVGISFYTFQALGYTIDVYRGELAPERDFITYALFVSFFPQLVAGPIERSANLIKQLDLKNRFDFVQARDGLLIMLWGYFLKIVIADRIAPFVDAVYGAPADYPGISIVIATVLFGIQIYCDFYGYSTIATGAAQILGIKLMDNFDAPYLADSVAGFWRRWHISLTSWFKDYLYIPLGGNRRGRLRKYINIMIVFLVSGLWHGASMAFVIWGGINGLYQVIGELTSPIRERIRIHRPFRILCTFILVDFAWLFFRAGDISQAISVLKAMFNHRAWSDVADASSLSVRTMFEGGLPVFICVLISVLILLVSDICRERGYIIRKHISNLRWWFRLPVMVIIVCAILVFGVWGSAYDAAGFIYFQF